MLHTPIRTLDAGVMLARLEQALDGLASLADTFASDELDKAIDEPFNDVLEVYNMLEVFTRPADAYPPVLLMGENGSG